MSVLRRRILPLLVVALVGLSASACKEADLSPFRGYGAWVDTFDWSPTASGLRNPPFTVNTVDLMADAGVQTIWIQTSRGPLAQDVVDRPLLERIIARARTRGISVIGWYLPEHLDQTRDLRRLQAIATLDVDAIGVDIESWKLKDVPLRNRRLIDLMKRLDDSVALPVSAVTVPPYAYEVLRPDLWPDFPYRQIDPFVENWTIMAYWTYRQPGTRERDPYFYLTENVRRLRANLGRPEYTDIHLAGGVADKVTVEDVRAMRRAAVETKAMGASLYDWTVTPASLLEPMRGFRDFRDGQPTK